ncbi:MAG: ADP-ribosylation factor-like protein [Candidatus Odinarchaeota archaeon]
MLVHFSVASKAGYEIFKHEEEDIQRLVDFHILSSFISALQAVSERMKNPIKQVNLSDMFLYVKSYGDFSLRMLLQESLSEKEIDWHFTRLSNTVIDLLSKVPDGIYPDKNVFETRLLPVLTPLLEGRIAKEKSRIARGTEPFSRITLAGLGGAGKTSIKNLFFENWTKKMVRNVKPTIGVEISKKSQEFVDQKFVIMDCGGQESFLEQHLSREDIWFNLTALIFVIDIQNPKLFKQSCSYLTRIWKQIPRYNEKEPKLTIFLHKYDPDKREKLDKNIEKCLSVFKEFVTIASFHLTTIEEATTSNLAMIKTLYLSIPDVIIKRILEEEFLDHFEQEIIPRFSSESIQQDEFQQIKDELRKSAIKQGFSYSLSVQESWLRYLMGDWAPKQRPLMSKSLVVAQKGQSLYIQIPDWSQNGIPKEMTDVLLDGMLEGIFSTMQLEAPQIVEKEPNFTKWKIEI